MQDWVSRLGQKGSLVAKIAKVKWLIVLHQPFYDLLLQLLICSFLHATVVTTVYRLYSKTSAIHLLVWSEINCTVHGALPKRPLTQF